MKNNNIDIDRRDRALQLALKSMPSGEARLPSNFTWRTMESIYSMETRRRRTQERVAKYVWICLCVILAILAVGIAFLVAASSIGAAIAGSLAGINRVFNSVTPVMWSVIAAIIVLVGAEHLLVNAYLRRSKP